MSALKRRLREQSEHYLLLDAAERLGKGVPSTFKPYHRAEGRFWRLFFVPLYRRVPWAFKRRAMHTLKMTASGWTPPSREPGQPWRPPAKR
jgi:hypothetical protein